MLYFVTLLHFPKTAVFSLFNTAQTTPQPQTVTMCPQYVVCYGTILFLNQEYKKTIWSYKTTFSFLNQQQDTVQNL